MPAIESDQSIPIFGKCLSKFSKVESVFRKLFRENLEYAGASIAICHRGELVVDLSGGWADKSARIEWTPDTCSVLFSITKGVSAIVVAMLVDRGHLNYSDRVSSFWPEFAQNGKETITVEWIMDHRAGLAVFSDPITIEDAEDPVRISRIIERTTPIWEPGTKSGYHAVTYGWLVDQIVRRLDPKRRGVSQFLQEEICSVYGIKFHIGITENQNLPVSRIELPSQSYVLREVINDPRIFLILANKHLRLPGAMVRRVAPPWLRIEPNFCTFNNPRIQRLEQPGALGIGRARDVAELFALFLSGTLFNGRINCSEKNGNENNQQNEHDCQKKLLLLSRLHKPTVVGRDIVIGLPFPKGHGFIYERHPKKSRKWLYGHPGYGGSTVMVDPEEELVICYVSNGIKTGMGILSKPYTLLRDAAFDSVEKMNV